MGTEDRISALPDGIVCHILSFLPTQDAIATSLLSKRWQPLWLSVPVLHLDDRTFLRNGRPYSSFVTFAYAALLSRSVHQPLTRFRLNSGASRNDFPYSHFKIWVNIVVQRGVEHLHMYMPFELKLPSSVLSCTTLVVLKLGRLYVKALGSVHLPALKTLHFDYCGMSETRNLAEVILGCPILEDLRANYVYAYGNLDVVQFQSMPKLVRADISNNDGFEIPLKSVCNVKHLRFLEFNHQECFPVFYNLIHLELKFKGYFKWHLVLEMLKHCPKLQSFVLHKSSESSPPEIWACPQIVPECISSQLRKCTILRYKGKESDLQFAEYIMKNSRALQTMTIHSKYSSNPQDKLEMLQKLAMCPRSSATCKLLFK